MRLVRLILWCAAAVLGVITAVRFLIGPYSILGIAVNTPLNPEGIFGAIITALIALRPSSKEDHPASATPWPVFVAMGAALISLHSALNVHFLSDDFIIVDLARAWTSANIVPLFTTAGGDGFFRPLGYLSFALDSAIGGSNPGWWHFTALMLHLVNSGLVAMLAARWGASNLVACVAGILFAVHGTHLETAVWVAGRFDLLAVFFTLAALLLFGRNTYLAIACTLAALWSKEAAYVLPGLVAIVAWHERRGWRSILPYFTVTTAAFLYRWILLGGIGGYREQGGQALFYSLKLTTTGKVLFVRLWTSLYFPINWSLDPAKWIGILALVYIAALLWLALKATPSRTMRVAQASLALAILPPLHLLGGAADLSGGRLLYLPSVFFCVMLAASLETFGRMQRITLALALVSFHAAAVHHDLPFWHAAGDRVHAMCAEAAENGTAVVDPPRLIHGVPALANGSSQCVELARH